MPRYLRFGLQTREDWERYKHERLDFRNPGRIGNIRKTVDNAHAKGMPVLFHCGSLYGWLRNWMGVEGFSMALMTDRAWVEEMMEHLTKMTLHFVEEILPGVEIDVAWWWEDMCYNRGPLMSPRLFQELMVPRYRRITSALRAIGVDVNVLDCDGNITALVPGWLEGGINCMFPLEVAHTDPFMLRERYGRDVLLMGGVNKLSLIAGKEAIDREIEKLLPLVRAGGFLPCVDHRVPPDVRWDDYLYYLEQKKRLLEA
jgi:uroporphyrinogen decarboxylase